MRKKNEKTGNMVGTIMMIANIVAIVMAAVIGGIGYNHIKKAYFTSFAEGLHAASILVEDTFSNAVPGDWSLSEDGQLMKGDEIVTEQYQNQIDALNKKTGMHYTIFYGDTRYITSLKDASSGKRMTGTKASDVVIDEVLKKGNEYLAENFEIAGQDWYAYYIPLKNSDSTIVGMVFAGRDTTLVVNNMKAAGRAIIATFLIFFIFTLIVARILILKSTRSIRDIIGGLKQLQEGDLFFYIDEKTFNRNDELGIIAEASAQVRDKLQDVISVTKKLTANVTESGISLAKSAESASLVAEQVTNAVEDISRGAASQAENVENSVNNTNEMGNSIDDITERVEVLSNAANEMLNGANRTVDTLNNLMDKNENVIVSMQSIDSQIRLTNESVKDIAEATHMITEIAEQTNLLSLNATIEAARAGDHGKGFAVVASEIGILSERSQEAAASIQKIVETLVQESQKNVEIIKELSESIQEQNDQLNFTKNDMDIVVENVNNVDDSTRQIAHKVHLLNQLKTSFLDIIAELSAISQQNAASTQETNASMEELNATFALISDAANDLSNMAETLNEEMDYFTLENVAA